MTTNNRFLFGGQESVSAVLQELDQINQKNSQQFKSKYDGSEWEQVESSSAYIGPSVPILIKIPSPTKSKLLELLFDSSHNDEAYAAALLLKDNENNKQEEFRGSLIEELKGINIAKLNNGQKARIQNVILFSELDHGENRRGVMGKTSEEIGSDSQFFMQTAFEAMEILDNLKPSFLEQIWMKLKKPFS